jgi:tetratricopeptide (TPR) repeat protein
MREAPAGRPAATSQIRTAVPATNITVDDSEALFTTMCALHAAGFESDVSTAGWHPLRVQLRDILLKQEGPAVDAVREYFKQHQLVDSGATLSRYIWFGVVVGPAPKFAYVMRHDDLPPEVLAIEDFNELLAAYYAEQHIGELWRKIQPAYNQEIARLHEPITQIVVQANGYLREILKPESQRTFSVVVEPMVGRKTNALNFTEHYSVLLSGVGDIPTAEIRHAFLHFMLDWLPLRYPNVVAVKRPLLDIAVHAPRLPNEFKDDFPSFFTECLVRAVELRLQKLSPGQIAARIDRDEANGFVLVRSLLGALGKFEKAAPAMQYYFPDMVRTIDTGAEAKRLETVKFAEAETASASAEGTQAEGEPVKVRPALPAGVPNDPEALAALTEGERQIALKNAAAASAAFQRVLVKYPSQPRAWYGLALVALLEGNGGKAKELFGHLVGQKSEKDGDGAGGNPVREGAAVGPAATKDPLVLAWSHVYLGRIFDDEGEHDRAREEYRAAAATEGAPEAARHAAQRALDKKR